MAYVAFPRAIPAEIVFSQPDNGVDALAGQYSLDAPQLIGRGVMPWEGTITWPIGVWDPTLGGTSANFNEIQAFIDSLEGGLNHFHIPLAPVLKGRSPRFPSKDETSAANSVKVTGQTPFNSVAGRLGVAATLTLDTPATQTTGLRKGDWISLHPNNDTPDSDTSHRGAYRCFTDQAGDQVSVRPAPTPINFDGGNEHRVRTIEPTLRAILAGPLPSVSLSGEFHQPITIQWRAYRG